MIPGSNLARIRYGYVKVAELYALMGEKGKTANLLQKAQAEMIDDVYRVDVMIEIALGYHSINQRDAALFTLASAQSLAMSDPTKPRVDLVPSPTTPAEAATIIYEKLIKAYEKIGDKGLVQTTTMNYFLPWAKQIHEEGKINDALAVKECDYLLRAALYLDRAGYHNDALNALTAAQESTRQIAVVATRLKKVLNIIAAYAAVHEYEKALALALSLEYTTERNQAIQTLANAYIDRDDFPDTWVASIDSDGDGRPDFFNPLAGAEEIAASGLIMDDDSDGDGIPDSEDFRPLFDDRQ
jgi:tetratricopeptide (TPR) repeat protein